ncbi:MAG: hypothetical protein B6U78_02230 [Candidatus Aenigmarchaeota archaeon ex4484_224]|nr:MAG: hypothetical protein B6U78_02230 [Candidatus Aenigmarchaeota archaeon ex4484_224]
MKKFYLLVSKEGSILVEVGKKRFVNTHFGKIDTKELKEGKFVKTHLGKEFLVLRALPKDILLKKIVRTAQVILPKDIGLILSYVSLKEDPLIVDAGTGTGYSAILLALVFPKGKVVSYEINDLFYRKAVENLKLVGIKNVRIKKKDVTKKIDEKNVDLILLDLKDVVKVIKKAWKALKNGGYLVIYSPTVDELLEVNRELENYEYFDKVIFEGIVREWQYTKTLRPKTLGLMHTGFITIVRKFK